MLELHGEWKKALYEEFNKEYYVNLMEKLETEYSLYDVFPVKEDVFNAFKYTELSDVKVVILGQDPYHDVGQAHGLAFSVKKDIAIPRSLMNMYKELNCELDTYIPNNGYLEKWARQGVLLLNTILTVRAHEAASHKDFGWQNFTDAVIRVLNKQDRPIVFFLWGNHAREKVKMLNNPRHLILESAHPSPLSARRGFFGNNHFKSANEFLSNNGESPIDWQIENI